MEFEYMTPPHERWVEEDWLLWRNVVVSGIPSFYEVFDQFTYMPINAHLAYFYAYNKKISQTGW